MRFECCHSWKYIGKDIFQCDFCHMTSIEEIYKTELEHNCNHSWKIAGNDIHLGYLRTYSENSEKFKEKMNEIYQCEFCKKTI